MITETKYFSLHLLPVLSVFESSSIHKHELNYALTSLPCHCSPFPHFLPGLFHANHLHLLRGAAPATPYPSTHVSPPLSLSQHKCRVEKIMWGTMRHFCITFLFCFFLLTWNTKILVLLLRNVGTLQNQIWEFNQCVTIIKICVLSTNLQYYTFLLQTQIQYQLSPPFFFILWNNETDC